MLLSNNIYKHKIDVIVGININPSSKCKYDTNAYIQSNNALLFLDFH